ncbi:MAG: hypothetical protein WBA41_21745, partial [Rivularia sp. (in: cyanobacteria)]
MTIGKFIKHGSKLTNLQLLKFVYFGSRNHPLLIIGKSGFWSKVQLMERIIRLNAVKILCPSGISGMNQHSLHPDEHLAPQKTIWRVSFASLTEAFLNTPNTKLGSSTLLRLKAAVRNTGFLPVLLPFLFSKPLNLALAPLSYSRFQSDRTTIKSSFYENKPGFLSPIENSARCQLKALSYLVLKDCIILMMIFAIGRIKKKKIWLWVVEACKLILPLFVLQKQVKTRDKKAFYNKPAVLLTNLPSRQVNIFNNEDKVQIKLARIGDRYCEFMCRKVVSIYDTRIKRKLAGAY